MLSFEAKGYHMTTTNSHTYPDLTCPDRTYHSAVALARLRAAVSWVSYNSTALFPEDSSAEAVCQTILST